MAMGELFLAVKIKARKTEFNGAKCASLHKFCQIPEQVMFGFLCHHT
jgi:hypothetical protein